MGALTERPRSDFSRSAPYWLRRIGVESWLLVGIVLAIAIVLSALTAVSGLVTPLVVAVILGLLAEPIVEWLRGHRVPGNAAAVLTLLLILAFGVVVAFVVISAIVDQSGDIARQLSRGWVAIEDWWQGLDMNADDVAWTRTVLEDGLPALGQGLAGIVGGVFSSATAFFVGLFFGVFVLFYMLRDGLLVRRWLARHIGVDAAVGDAILADAAAALRAYFRGTAMVAALTALIVAVPLVLLDVPLLVPILLVYFLSSFVPYVGAFVGGAFAVIIAFGSGGPETAFLVLAAVIVSNGSIQTALNSWLIGSSLRLHPLVILLVTSVAGVAGGFVSMVLAAPLTAITVSTVRRLRDAGVFEEEQIARSTGEEQEAGRLLSDA